MENFFNCDTFKSNFRKRFIIKLLKDNLQRLYSISYLKSSHIKFKQFYSNLFLTFPNPKNSNTQNPNGIRIHYDLFYSKIFQNLIYRILVYTIPMELEFIKTFFIPKPYIQTIQNPIK